MESNFYNSLSLIFVWESVFDLELSAAWKSIRTLRFLHFLFYATVKSNSNPKFSYGLLSKWSHRAWFIVTEMTRPRKIYLSSRNDLYIPLILVFVFLVSLISPLKGKKLWIVFHLLQLRCIPSPLSSTIPRSTPSISSSHPPLPPSTCRVKNINTGTSCTFPLYIFLPLQGKEVNCFSFASPPPPPPSPSLSFSLFIFSPFPLLPSQSLPSPLLPSTLGLRLYPSNKSSRPASITLLSEVLYFVSIFLQVTHVNVFLFWNIRKSKRTARKSFFLSAIVSGKKEEGMSSAPNCTFPNCLFLDN